MQLVKSCSLLRLKKMSGKRKSKKSVGEGVVEIDNENLNAGDTKKQTRKSNNSRNKIVQYLPNYSKKKKGFNLFYI